MNPILLLMSFDHNAASNAVKITKSPFGKTPNGDLADLYTLESENGITARISNYGGILTQLLVPDAAGNLRNVVLGFESIEQYIKENIYAGAIVGRVAGRIKNAQFSLDEKQFYLSQNGGVHHVHGGIEGLDKKLWDVALDDRSITLRTRLLDGEEGYPGNVEVEVKYSISKYNGLRIDFKARSDQSTPLALTNHAYFNLAGKGNILDHTLQIDADYVIGMDKNMHANGEKLAVETQSNDFRSPAILKSRINSLHQQHGDLYVLNNDKERRMKSVAQLACPASGIKMKVLTDAPCMQFYTGVGLKTQENGMTKTSYSAFNGLCLECQDFADALRHLAFGFQSFAPRRGFYPVH